MGIMYSEALINSMTWCAVEQRDLRFLVFPFFRFSVYLYINLCAFCQCVNSVDTHGTAIYQKMKFEFAITICRVDS